MNAYPDAPGHRNVDTSVAAALALAPKLGRLQRMTVAAIRDAEVNKRLQALGVIVDGSTPEEFSAFLKREVDKWGPVIKEAGIRVGGGPQ